MARPLRLEYPGALYHVTARGNRREDIYHTDTDRSAFLALLGETCERFGWRCLAYCLMTNHYHVVVETPDANLSRGMRQLNGVYTQGFNRRHRRVGHVFQGRYHAVIVDRDAYLLEVVRYVILNPVRAGMVTAAGQWPWSSYCAVIGRTPHPAWLTVDEVLTLFGSERGAAVRRFIRFVADARSSQTLWQHLKDQIYLGDEEFVERLKRRIVSDSALDEIPLRQHRPAAAPLAHIARDYPDRARAMACAYATGSYTLKEIAEHFGVHYSTVSRALGRRDKD
jgi:putative transposase